MGEDVEVLVLVLGPLSTYQTIYIFWNLMTHSIHRPPAMCNQLIIPWPNYNLVMMKLGRVAQQAFWIRSITFMAHLLDTCWSIPRQHCFNIKMLGTGVECWWQAIEIGEKPLPGFEMPGAERWFFDCSHHWPPNFPTEKNEWIKCSLQTWFSN